MPVRTEGGADQYLRFTLRSATLTYFARGTKPSTPENALLMLTVQHEPSGGGVTSCAVPLSAYLLQRPTGASYQPRADASAVSTSSARLVFEVPSFIERFTLRVHEDALSCNSSRGKTQWQVTKPAKIDHQVPA